MSARFEKYSAPSIASTHSKSETANSSDNEANLGPLDKEATDFFPEGGLTAWRQVLAGHFVNALSNGNGASFGIYQLHYAATLGMDSAAVAWIGSFQVFLHSAVCVIGGRLCDAGYEYETALAGSALLLLGTFLTSLATEYWQIFLAQGLVTGFGMGLLYMPSTSVISSYFNRRRSMALSIASTGTGTGSLVFPAVVNYLIPTIGFAWAVRCSALVALVMVVIVLVLLQPRKMTRKAGPMFEWAAFREKPYVLFTAGTFLFYLALYFGFFYIDTFAMTLPNAFTATSTVSLLLITNAVSTPARVLVGYVADYHLGALNTYVLSVAVFSVTIYGWAGVHTASGMYFWSAAFGLTNGLAQGAFVNALASLTSDPCRMGSRFGMVCTICAFASLAGPPLAGAIVDAQGGSYMGAQVWGGSVEAAATVVLAAMRWAVEGRVRAFV